MRISFNGHSHPATLNPLHSHKIGAQRVYFLWLRILVLVG